MNKLEKNIFFFNWTNQSFQRILKINLVFYWTTYFFGTNFLKKTIVFLLNVRFYWKNDFTEWNILLDKRFFWTIVQWTKERKIWKMTDNFAKEQNHFFTQLKKTRTKSIIHEQWTNKMKKSWTRPSLPVIVSVYVPSGLVTLKYIYKLTNDIINLSTADW